MQEDVLIVVEPGKEIEEVAASMACCKAGPVATKTEEE